MIDVKMEDWWIAAWGPLIVIGRSTRSNIAPSLSPVYQLNVGFVEGNGQLHCVRDVKPLLTMVSIGVVDSDVRLLYPCADLSLPERKSLVTAIERCEDTIKRLRVAEGSGLVL